MKRPSISKDQLLNLGYLLLTIGVTLLLARHQNDGYMKIWVALTVLGLVAVISALFRSGQQKPRRIAFDTDTKSKLWVKNAHIKNHDTAFRTKGTSTVDAEM